MNEQAIKELYWEFRTRGIRLNKKLSELDGVEKDKLNKRLRELSNLVKQLSAKAEEKGIDVKDKTGITVVDDASDDWTQLLGISSLPKGVKGVLKAKIESLGTKPTASQMNNLLKFCEKYYTQNITKLTKERAIKSFEKNKGKYTNQDVDKIVADYKKAAKVTLSESIKKLDTSFQLQMVEVQPIFDSYHSGEKVMEGDENNDWKTQLKESDLLAEIKQALEQKITTLAPPPTPKQMRMLLGNIDKYYQVNVNQVDEAALIKTYEQHEGRYTDQDLDGIAEKHKKTAISAIMKQIDELNTDFSFDESAAHDAFVSIYKGKTLMDAVTDGITSVPHQFKLDLVEKEFDGVEEIKVGFLKFHSPILQASVKGAFVKKAHLIRMSKEAATEKVKEHYAQLVRITFSGAFITNYFNETGKKANGSANITVFSKGTVFEGPFGGNMILKTDLGKFTWKELSLKPKPSLGSIALQYKWDFAKYMEWDAIANGTLSLGYKVSIDMEELKKFIDNLKKVKGKKKTNVPKPEIDDDDMKAIKKLQEKGDQLIEEASDLKKGLESFDKTHDKGKLKNAVDKVKGTLDDITETLEKHLWKSDVAKEMAEKVVEKTTKKALQIIGKNGLAIAGRILGHSVPVFSLFMTAYEVGSMLNDLIIWLGEGKLHWEAKVENYITQKTTELAELANEAKETLEDATESIIEHTSEFISDVGDMIWGE